MINNFIYKKRDSTFKGVSFSLIISFRNSRVHIKTIEKFIITISLSNELFLKLEYHLLYKEKLLLVFLFSCFFVYYYCYDDFCKRNKGVASIYTFFFKWAPEGRQVFLFNSIIFSRMYIVCAKREKFITTSKLIRINNNNGQIKKSWIMEF